MIELPDSTEYVFVNVVEMRDLIDTFAEPDVAEDFSHFVSQSVDTLTEEQKQNLTMGFAIRREAEMHLTSGVVAPGYRVCLMGTDLNAQVEAPGNMVMFQCCFLSADDRLVEFIEVIKPS